MLWELISEDNVLTISIILIGILWVIVFMRNFWNVKKSSGEFERAYEHILNAEEFKVKGKYEQ